MQKFKFVFLILLLSMFKHYNQNNLEEQFKNFTEKINHKFGFVGDRFNRQKLLGQEYYNLKHHAQNGQRGLNKFSIMTPEEKEKYFGFKINSFQIFIKSKEEFKSQFVGFIIDDSIKNDLNNLPSKFTDLLNSLQSEIDIFFAQTRTNFDVLDEYMMTLWTTQTRSKFISTIVTPTYNNFIATVKSQYTTVVTNPKSQILALLTLFKNKSTLSRTLRNSHYTKLYSQQTIFFNAVNVTYNALLKSIATSFNAFKSQIPATNPNNPPTPTPSTGFFNKVQTENLIPLEKNWVTENKVSPIRDQGQCGSCWAFAALGVLESYYMINKNLTYDLSEQNLLNCIPSNDCDGGYVSDTWDYIKDNGVHLETTFPYTAVEQTCTTSTNTKVEMSDWKQMSAIDDMYVFLKMLAVAPVHIIIPISKLMNYQSGIVDGYSTLNCPSSPNYDHAIQAVGYKIDIANPTQSYILIKNSWNTDWGENGYIRFQLQNLQVTRGPCWIIHVNYETIQPILA